MGVSKMEVGGAQGSLVWVQRRNGTWWPGRVVGPTEISPSAAPRRQLSSASSSSSSSSSSSAFKTPVMLLGKDYHSVDWYNLEKSKRIKAFRCGEFDDCIRKAESSQASTFAENMKYVRRRDAILHALALEKNDQQRKLKRTGEVQAETVCRAKRSRYICLPIQSQSSKVSTSRVESDDSTFVSGVSAENNASGETESPPLKHERGGAAQSRVVHALGHSQRQPRRIKIKKQDELCKSSKSPNCHWIDGVGLQKEMQKGKSYVTGIGGSPSTSGKRFVIKISTRKETDPLAMDASVGCTSETQSVENLDRGVSQSALGGSTSHDFDSSAYTGQQNGMETMLVDVDFTVEQNHRGDRVPFISLVSKTSGKAIIGHPIDIEVLHDSSETFLRRKYSISKMPFEDDRRRIHQLAWRTSRRTPVCYVSNSHGHPTPKNIKSVMAGQSFSTSRANGSDCCLAMESSGKSIKKCNFSNDKTLLSHSIKHKGSGNDSHRVTCVPVKQVFSKLFEAVGKF